MALLILSATQARHLGRIFKFSPPSDLPHAYWLSSHLTAYFWYLWILYLPLHLYHLCPRSHHHSSPLARESLPFISYLLFLTKCFSTRKTFLTDQIKICLSLPLGPIMLSFYLFILFCLFFLIFFPLYSMMLYGMLGKTQEKPWIVVLICGHLFM